METEWAVLRLSNSEAAVDKYLSEQHMQGFSGGFRRPKIESPNQDLRNVQFETLSVQVECVPLPLPCVVETNNKHLRDRLS